MNDEWNQTRQLCVDFMWIGRMTHVMIKGLYLNSVAVVECLSMDEKVCGSTLFNSIVLPRSALHIHLAPAAYQVVFFYTSMLNWCCLGLTGEKEITVEGAVVMFSCYFKLSDD